jgi:hypothetical protein
MKTIGAQIALFWQGLTGLLGRILGSRKMILNIVGAAIAVIVLVDPALAERASNIGFYVYLVLVVLGGGGLLEIGDLVKAYAERPANVQAAVEAIKAELETPKGTVG